ncbi:MAG: hypothetical protein WCY77_01885 [Weeksellaceae bacterium]
MKTTKLLRVAGVIGQQANTAELSSLEAIKAFVRLVIDWITGKYSPKKRNLLIGTLVIIYVISPLDLLPGIILDDAIIVLFALKYFKKEITKYVNWEKSRKFNFEVSDAEIIRE